MRREFPLIRRFSVSGDIYVAQYALDENIRYWAFIKTLSFSFFFGFFFVYEISGFLQASVAE